MNTTAPAIDMLEALNARTYNVGRSWEVADIIKQAFPDNSTAVALQQAVHNYGNALESIQSYLTRTAKDAEKGLADIANGYSVSSLTFFCTANDHERYVRDVAFAKAGAEFIITLADVLGISKQVLAAMFAALHGVQK